MVSKLHRILRNEMKGFVIFVDLLICHPCLNIAKYNLQYNAPPLPIKSLFNVILFLKSFNQSIHSKNK